MSFIYNPVLTGFNPDPSICRVGTDYYIATSTFEWFPGVQIFHSRDLVNWRLVARPLNRVSLLDMKGCPNSGGVWAPNLTYSDKKFWLIYTNIKNYCGKWKDGHNYITTCSTVDGDWDEPVYINSSGFDPSIFHSEDGRKYILNVMWDHRFDKNSFSGISLQEFSVNGNKLIGSSKNIFHGTRLMLTEGPNLYKIKDYFYLLTAEGGTGYHHAVTVARSRKIDGPYEVHPQNPILTAWDKPEYKLQKCGHASLVHTHTNEWYIAHLTSRPLEHEKPILDHRGFCPLGRETALQKIIWLDDWPYVEGGKHGAMIVQAPAIPPCQWDEDTLMLDHFDSKTLNYNFQTLRIPLPDEIMSLKDNPGHLRLYGKESLNSKFTQALVARRWQSFYFDAGTSVSFFPKSFKQSAGLVCYYNTDNWTSIQITLDDDNARIIEIISCDDLKFKKHKPLDGGGISHEVELVYLKVQVRNNFYTFLYSFNGVDWKDTGHKFESYKLSDDYVNHYGFTGAFVGMHCQDSLGEDHYADFDFFFYKDL